MTPIRSAGRGITLASAGIAILLLAAFRSPARPTAWYYTGKHAREVQYLLERVDGWKLPSCATCSDLKAPDLPINPNAPQRDSHVDAAATLAYGAEAYAKVGKPDEAERAAESAHKELEYANSLCSDALRIEARGMTSATLRIWPCPAPFSLDNPE
jgi:hypothetical protein